MGLENYTHSFWDFSDSGGSLWLELWASSTSDL